MQGMAREFVHQREEVSAYPPTQILFCAISDFHDAPQLLVLSSLGSVWPKTLIERLTWQRTSLMTPPKLDVSIPHKMHTIGDKPCDSRITVGRNTNITPPYPMGSKSRQAPRKIERRNGKACFVMPLRYWSTRLVLLATVSSTWEEPSVEVCPKVLEMLKCK